MPGFGNNTQGVQGGAVSPTSTGSVRFPLTPFATRDAFTGVSHTADTINFKNNGTPLPVSGGGGNEASCIHVASLTALDVGTVVSSTPKVVTIVFKFLSEKVDVIL